MIISESVKLKLTKNVSTKYIEKELEKIGINPLRWAIVSVEKENYIISVAYERK